MKVFTIILGVLMSICGLSCIFTPVMTFLEAGYFLAVLLLVYGIGIVVRCVKAKRYGVPLVFAILTVILGCVILFVPGMRLTTDGMVIYFMAAWFIVQGILGIVNAVKQKSAGTGKGWILTLILGILGTLLGLYSAMHPLLLAFTFGILIGMYFIESGITLIVGSCQK